MGMVQYGMTTPHDPNDPLPPDEAARALTHRAFLVFRNDDVNDFRTMLDEGMDPYAMRPVGRLDLMSMIIGQRHGAKELRKLVLSTALNLDPTRMGTPKDGQGSDLVHTPWHMAARWRDTAGIKAMVKLCERHGKRPNVNVLDAQGETPLVLAMLHPLTVKKPKFDTLHASAQALIDAGADVNARCKNGRTLYQEMTARHTNLFKENRVPMSHLVMLGAFVPAGLDPNLPGSHGNTLMHDIASTAPSHLPMLLKAGGRLFDRNDAGKTVLDYLDPAQQSTLQTYIVQEESRVLRATIDGTATSEPDPSNARRRL